MRIQDLVKAGAQLLRLKVSNLVEWRHVRKVSYMWLGSRALEVFGFLMLKYMHLTTAKKLPPVGLNLIQEIITVLGVQCLTKSAKLACLGDL